MNASLFPWHPPLALPFSQQASHHPICIKRDTWCLWQKSQSTVFVTLAQDKGKDIFCLLNTGEMKRQKASPCNHIFVKTKCRLLQSEFRLNCFTSSFSLKGQLLSLVCHRWFCVCITDRIHAWCRWGLSATDLYMPFLQKTCNFTDRIHFCRQLVRDKEHRKASPPHRQAVCLRVLSFLLLDRALCCLAEHERDSSTPNSLYLVSRLHRVPSENTFSCNLLIF